MITFMDMCFCGTMECKERKKCARALENYGDKVRKVNAYFSMCDFNCPTREDGRRMFIKFNRRKRNEAIL